MDSIASLQSVHEVMRFTMSDSGTSNALTRSESPADVINAFGRRIRGIRICALKLIPRAKDVQEQTLAASFAALLLRALNT